MEKKKTSVLIRIKGKVLTVANVARSVSSDLDILFFLDVVDLASSSVLMKF